MDLITSYSSDEDDLEQSLPGIPDDIVNKYSKKPKLATNTSTTMTSFVYYNWRLSQSEADKIANILKDIPHTKSLVQNDQFKIVNDLHISLSLNFKLELKDFDKLINEIDAQIRKCPITVRFKDKLHILKSQTSGKSFLVMVLKPNNELNILIKDLNRVIRGFDSTYTGYNSDMVHCSIAETVNDSQEIEDNDVAIRNNDLVVNLDKVSISRGRTVQTVYLV